MRIVLCVANERTDITASFLSANRFFFSFIIVCHRSSIRLRLRATRPINGDATRDARSTMLAEFIKNENECLRHIWTDYTSVILRLCQFYWAHRIACRLKSQHIKTNGWKFQFDWFESLSASRIKYLQLDVKITCRFWFFWFSSIVFFRRMHFALWERAASAHLTSTTDSRSLSHLGRCDKNRSPISQANDLWSAINLRFDSSREQIFA